MGPKTDKKLNKEQDDILFGVRDLLHGAQSSSLSVDDILSEYGIQKPVGHPAEPLMEDKKTVEAKGPELLFDLVPPPSPRKAVDNTVAFPTPKKQAKKVEEEDTDIPEEAEAEEIIPQNILQFPQMDDEEEEEESVIPAFIINLGRKADEYADSMFEESESIDPEEVRRLEALIPGTDEEEEDEEVPTARRIKPKREPAPPPPDLSPQELMRTFSKGLGLLHMRCMSVLVLALLSAYLVLAPELNLILPPIFLSDPSYPLWISVGLLGLGMILSGDFILMGLWRGLHLKLGMDTLVALASIVSVLDGVQLAFALNRGGELPYCSVNLVALFFLMYGNYRKRCALRLACRTAAATKEPYRVTMDEGKWSGRDTYTKCKGTSEGFGSQIQMDDGAQILFAIACPLLLLGCVVIAVWNSYGSGRPEYLLWNLSATLTSVTALGGTLVFGRANHKVEQRLSRSGATLAGWLGIANSTKGDRVILNDGDLFPPGHVELNGMKVYGNAHLNQMVAYTASLIRVSGCGLEQLFYNELRSQGGTYRTVRGVSYYEGGGVSATIINDRVLVGSAAFMNLMDVDLPNGLRVKQAVFCAINGELSGVFALKYTMSDGVFAAVNTLLDDGVGGIIATRDFNLIPSMLQHRFRLPADRMDFPPVDRRRELSDPDQSHNAVLTAVLCREGLAPFAEAVVGARRLCVATRRGAGLCIASAVVCLALAGYLTAELAFSSLSPFNLLLFQLSWLAPCWFLTDWAHRY